MSKQTKIDLILSKYAEHMLARLGYPAQEIADSPGALREARELIGQVYSKGQVTGYAEGHKHGWEDRGRDPGETELPRRKYTPPVI